MSRHKNRILFANNKGGVGKTTSLVEICAHAVFKNKKVLIIDMDPQGCASRVFLGEIPGPKDSTIFDVLVGQAEVTDALKKATENWPRVHVLGANQKLEVAHKFLEPEPGWETALDEVVESIEENFDLILIDSPPALGLLTKIAIRAANKLVIPTDISLYADDGLSKLLALVDHIEKKTKHKIDLVKVVVTAMQKGGAHATRNALKRLQDEVGEMFMPVELPHTIKVFEAQREAQPRAAAQMLDEDHKLYVGYQKLFEAII